MKLLGKPILTPTSSDHHAVTATYEIAGQQVRVTTWNVGDGPFAKKKADARKLAAISDVMLLQEVGDRDTVKLLGAGWSGWKKSRVAIAWRTDFPPVEWTEHLLSTTAEGRNMDPGAGPEDVQRKDLVGARWDIGGESLSIGCVHLVATSHKPKRGRLARLQVDRIAEWVRAQPGHVIVGGDMNTTPDNPILDPLERAGMRRAMSGATHGKRAIDHIWTLAKATQPPPEEPMPICANGWPAITSARFDGDHPRLRRWTIAPTGQVVALRDGSAGFCLVHFASWWHDHIETIDEGIFDDWGYAYRPIRGATRLSNHAGGVAVDVNATQHPLGVPIGNTFSDEQIRKIRKQVKFYEGLVDWGGEWGRPDGMHLELAPGTSIDDAERIAVKLMGTKRGKAILDANPGAEAVILDGNEYAKKPDPPKDEPKPPVKHKVGFRVLAAQRLLKLAHKRSTRVGHEGNKAALTEALAALGRVEPE